MTQFTAHHYNGSRKSIYYIDGKRVSESAFQLEKDKAGRKGALSSFLTKAGKIQGHWVQHCQA